MVCYSIILTSPFKLIRRSNRIAFLIYPLSKGIAIAVIILKSLIICNYSIEFILIDNPGHTWSEYIRFCKVDLVRIITHVIEYKSYFRDIIHIIDRFKLNGLIMVSPFEFIRRLCNIAFLIYPSTEVIVFITVSKVFITFYSLIKVSLIKGPIGSIINLSGVSLIFRTVTAHVTEYNSNSGRCKTSINCSVSNCVILTGPS